MEEPPVRYYPLLARTAFAPFDQLIWHYPPEEGKVYLTFDDGPYPPVTAPLLNLLEEEDIAATFFLSGEQLFRYRHAVSALNYSRHLIGSHLYHHRPAIARSRARLCREIRLTSDLIRRSLGREVSCLRPPYGIFGAGLLAALRGTGQPIVMWSVMANDFKWSSGRVMSHLRRSVCPGDVLVFHDSPKTAAVLLEILPEFIRWCRGQGFSFAPLLLPGRS